MDNDIRRLFAAVATAIGHDLKVGKFDDRLSLQKGCYILNSWGYGPFFKFNMYIHGPYSSSLADEYYRIGDITFTETDVPADRVEDLSHIFEKGLPYAEAYATLMMIRNNSPGASYDGIIKRANELKPHLKEEIEEASASLLV